ncbi:unnamed protein product [Rotaria sordida]|uniref:Uncharacterized protein n=1 Tax=Rotaria sordida TaxID=392033 RepID=A0A814U500_9BILA|nr:unnamed protein product [Rotaria sordida]
METEVILQDDGKATTVTTAKRRQSTKRSNKWRSTLLRFGIGCLVIMVLAVLVYIVAYRLIPNIRESIDTDKKKPEIQEIFLKVIFSTNHVLDKGIQSLNIINIDNITNQLNTILNGHIISVVDAFFRNHSVSKGYFQ